MDIVRRGIKDGLLVADDLVKCTDLAYLHRASIRAFIGAALTVNATTDTALPPHLDAELRAHLRDELKPLGFTAKRIQKAATTRNSR
jgi:hypothetical protein